MSTRRFSVIGFGRQPLLHFFLIGGLLYGAERATAGWRAADAADPIFVTAAARADFARELRRPPTAREWQAQARRLADEEMLYREALRLGLDRSDPVVRSRLIQNLRFVEGGAGGDAALLRQAFALRMDRSDLVVRRRLIQLSERRLERGVRLGDDEVRAYAARDFERYRMPRRIVFTQVFLSADRHPQDLAQAAADLGARLTARPQSTADAEPGEPFLLGRVFALSETEAAARFGPAFAQALFQAPEGIWSGPLPSVYGLHFVRVDAVEEAQPAAFDEIRDQAYYALLEARQKQALQSGLAILRRRYPLVYEPAADPTASAG